MKKSELKKMLKPLIKECIKEVIFEEGALSTIITEVVKGTSQVHPIIETRQPEYDNSKKIKENKERKKKLLDSIGREAYNGVNLFEGTTPTTTQGSQGHGALKDVSPSDPGVDISKIFSNDSAKIWKKLSGK